MKLKVLIIEDNPEIAESVSLAVKIYMPEWEAVCAHLGEAGLRLALTESPDIVVLDLGLPDMSGIEVLKQLRRHTSVPVVVLTVKSEEDNVVEALENEANDYVTKPFRQRELLARLQAHASLYMTNRLKAHVA